MTKADALLLAERYTAAGYRKVSIGDISRIDTPNWVNVVRGTPGLHGLSRESIKNDWADYYRHHLSKDWIRRVPIEVYNLIPASILDSTGYVALGKEYEPKTWRAEEIEAVVSKYMDKHYLSPVALGTKIHEEIAKALETVPKYDGFFTPLFYDLKKPKTTTFRDIPIGTKFTATDAKKAFIKVQSTPRMHRNRPFAVNLSNGLIWWTKDKQAVIVVEDTNEGN